MTSLVRDKGRRGRPEGQPAVWDPIKRIFPYVFTCMISKTRHGACFPNMAVYSVCGDAGCSFLSDTDPFFGIDFIVGVFHEMKLNFLYYCSHSATSKLCWASDTSSQRFKNKSSVIQLDIKHRSHNANTVLSICKGSDYINVAMTEIVTHDSCKCLCQFEMVK